MALSTGVVVIGSGALPRSGVIVNEEMIRTASDISWLRSGRQRPDSETEYKDNTHNSSLRINNLYNILN